MHFTPTTSPADVFKLCTDHGVKVVDLRFMDFPGLWQHFTIPVEKIGQITYGHVTPDSVSTVRVSVDGRVSRRATCS